MSVKSTFVVLLLVCTCINAQLFMAIQPIQPVTMPTTIIAKTTSAPAISKTIAPPTTKVTTAPPNAGPSAFLISFMDKVMGLRGTGMGTVKRGVILNQEQKIELNSWNPVTLTDYQCKTPLPEVFVSQCKNTPLFPPAVYSNDICQCEGTGLIYFFCKTMDPITFEPNFVIDMGNCKAGPKTNCLTSPSKDDITFNALSGLIGAEFPPRNYICPAVMLAKCTLTGWDYSSIDLTQCEKKVYVNGLYSAYEFPQSSILEAQTTLGSKSIWFKSTQSLKVNLILFGLNILRPKDIIYASIISVDDEHFVTVDFPSSVTKTQNVLVGWLCDNVVNKVVPHAEMFLYSRYEATTRFPAGGISSNLVGKSIYLAPAHYLSLDLFPITDVNLDQKSLTINIPKLPSAVTQYVFLKNPADLITIVEKPPVLPGTVFKVPLPPCNSGCFDWFGFCYERSNPFDYCGMVGKSRCSEECYEWAGECYDRSDIPTYEAKCPLGKGGSKIKDVIVSFIAPIPPCNTGCYDWFGFCFDRTNPFDYCGRVGKNRCSNDCYEWNGSCYDKSDSPTYSALCPAQKGSTIPNLKLSL